MEIAAWRRIDGLRARGSEGWRCRCGRDQQTLPACPGKEGSLLDRSSYAVASLPASLLVALGREAGRTGE